MRRVAASFRPYLREVLIVFAAIIVVGVMGVINPLMLKYSISIGFGQQRFDLLALFVAVMIIVPIITGLIGVGQTYLNSRIGQNVMRDFRNRLYIHLQRMPLKFFTDTRTGEIQSRLANDVGGVQSVVTDTATSTICQPHHRPLDGDWHVRALDWQLTLLSLGLLPRLHLPDDARRRGAARGQQGDAGVAGGDVLDGAGDALGQRRAADQDLRAAASRRSRASIKRTSAWWACRSASRWWVAGS